MVQYARITYVSTDITNDNKTYVVLISNGCTKCERACQEWVMYMFTCKHLFHHYKCLFAHDEYELIK